MTLAFQRHWRFLKHSGIAFQIIEKKEFVGCVNQNGDYIGTKFPIAWVHISLLVAYLRYRSSLNDSCRRSIWLWIFFCWSISNAFSAVGSSGSQSHCDRWYHRLLINQPTLTTLSGAVGCTTDQTRRLTRLTSWVLRCSTLPLRRFVMMATWNVLAVSFYTRDKNRFSPSRESLACLVCG